LIAYLMITYSYYNRSYMHYVRKNRAMNKEMMNDTLQELRKPFHPAHVTWKPGAVSKDQTKALALAYADLRAYQNRLDEVCGLDWSVTYTPWGERLVCHLTIQGVTRSSSGEPDSQAAPGALSAENAGTTTEAQAFKRACAMFGLGRYLYNLPSVWVEYDLNTNHFTEKAKAKLEGIIVQHYRRTVKDDVKAVSTDSGKDVGKDDANQEPEQTAQRPSEPEGEQAAESVQNSVASQPETPDTPPNGKLNGHNEDAYAANEGLDPLRQQFDQLGQELYGEQWSQVSRHNVERITGGTANESRVLTAEQIQKLVDGMKKLQRKRHTVVAMPERAIA